MRRPWVLVAVAAAVVAAGGWLLGVTWHLPYGTGLYCSVGTASTVGCDTGLSAAGQVAAVVVMLAAIPVLAAVFAWATGKHAASHVRQHLAEAEKRIAADADHRHVIMQRHVERLLAGHCADLKEHINAATGGTSEGH